MKSGEEEPSVTGYAPTAMSDAENNNDDDGEDFFSESSRSDLDEPRGDDDDDDDDNNVHMGSVGPAAAAAVSGSSSSSSAAAAAGVVTVMDPEERIRGSGPRRKQRELLCTAALACETVRVGPFWCPTEADPTNVHTLRDIVFFFTPLRIASYVLPVILQESQVSCRLLTWLVSRHAKTYPILYRYKIFEDTDPVLINVHAKYKDWVEQHHKTGFDAFCRTKEHWYFKVAPPSGAGAGAVSLESSPSAAAAVAAAAPKVGDVIYRTTSGQLNFLYFAWIHGMYHYAKRHKTELVLAMRNSSDGVAANPAPSLLSRAVAAAAGVNPGHTDPSLLFQPRSAAPVAAASAALVPPPRVVPNVLRLLNLTGQYPVTSTSRRARKKEHDPSIPKRKRGRPRKYPLAPDGTVMMPEPSLASSAFDTHSGFPSPYLHDSLSYMGGGLPPTAPMCAELAQSSSTACLDPSMFPLPIVRFKPPKPPKKKAPVDPNLPKKKRGRPRKVISAEEIAQKAEKLAAEEDDPYRALGLENRHLGGMPMGMGMGMGSMMMIAPGTALGSKKKNKQTRQRVRGFIPGQAEMGVVSGPLPMAPSQASSQASSSSPKSKRPRKKARRDNKGGGGDSAAKAAHDDQEEAKAMMVAAFRGTQVSAAQSSSSSAAASSLVAAAAGALTPAPLPPPVNDEEAMWGWFVVPS
jgi:hypothetical protein